MTVPRGEGSQADEAIAGAERQALRSVAAHLGSGLIEATRVPWGDSGSTFHIRLADGRSIAARHLIGPGSPERARAVVRRSDLLAASGIAVAHPAHVCSADDDSAWLLTPWVDGVVGAMALQAHGSSLDLADRMGRLATRLTGIDTDVLDSNRSWAGPGELAQAGLAWLADLRDALDPGNRRKAEQALDVVVAAWDDSAPWQVGLSHGDFAPINVIIDSDGNLVVLDLDDVQRGPRLLDVAWWGWVVRYHHPAAWAHSWSTFVAAAGLEPGPGSDAAATAVARVRLLERAARAPDTRLRAQWLQRLDQEHRLGAAAPREVNPAGPAP